MKRILAVVRAIARLPDSDTYLMPYAVNVSVAMFFLERLEKIAKRR